MAHLVNDFKHSLRFFKTAVDGLLQGAVMTQHPANLKAALQSGERLAKVMQICMHLIQKVLACHEIHRHRLSSASKLDRCLHVFLGCFNLGGRLFEARNPALVAEAVA